jgi:hypothetical protein
MTISHFCRRLHLYLGLALLPWFLMYGVSSIPFAHGQFFQKLDEARGVPLWQLRSERPYDAPVPENREALLEFGRKLLKELGIEGPNFSVYRANRTTLNVGSYSFLKSTRVVYSLDRKKLTVEDRRFRFDQLLTGMHARGGFERDGFLSKSWGVMVDLVCAAFLIWIGTGLYLWWGLPGHHGWGAVALATGTAVFLLFTLRL